MPFLDRTVDFRDAVEARRAVIPEAKRRNFSRRSQDTPGRMEKEYLSEGYKIVRCLNYLYVQNRLIKRLFQQFHHIRKLAQMLSSIRLAYLNLDGRVQPPSRLRPRNVDFTSESGEVPWSSLRYLTNEERDQIDLQTRMILAKCADKVKEMEILEKSSCVIRLMSS